MGLKLQLKFVLRTSTPSKKIQVFSLKIAEKFGVMQLGKKHFANLEKIVSRSPTGI